MNTGHVSDTDKPLHRLGIFSRATQHLHSQHKEHFMEIM